jgi:hypothetical protein
VHDYFAEEDKIHADLGIAFLVEELFLAKLYQVKGLKHLFDRFWRYSTEKVMILHEIHDGDIEHLFLVNSLIRILFETLTDHITLLIILRK